MNLLFKRSLVFVYLLFAFVLITVGYASAQSNSASQDNLNLASNVQDKTVYSVGETVANYDVINGDFYCAGNKVIIDAVIDGDIICMGKNVVVGGSVNGNIRAAANSITLTGKVGRNVTILAKAINTSPDSVIEEDATLIASAVELNGKVARDVNIKAGAVKINGTIGRNLQSYHQTLVFGENAKISGDFKYSSPLKVEIPDNTVAGDVSELTGVATGRKSSFLTSGVFLIAFIYIAWFISLLLAALGVAFLFPKSLEDGVSYAKTQPFNTAIAGIITLISAPIIIFLLAISLVGIPLAMLVGFLFGSILLLATPFVSHLIGSLLLPQRSHPIKALVGALIILLLFAVPVINIITFILVMVIGTGQIIRISASRYSHARHQYTKDKP